MIPYVILDMKKLLFERVGLLPRQPMLYHARLVAVLCGCCLSLCSFLSGKVLVCLVNILKCVDAGAIPALKDSVSILEIAVLKL